ncbi:Esterase/lipase superfamily enzyme [Bosea sp. 62]|nr:Esterase/lipase superfamily enzyme [Bosea sp. 21B]CAD5291270.1 Esterase/lipase superfamily enzyme [Bosea sp. 46]CAD5300735.1 Esterase/lipase superfamily enzyme [Bosea sp. 7B]VVT60295.1 Esterase/lipase superfamily enzyme [Bosea sp. EC-HK365B]VXA94633.1 Esterase/lipase superfamily enzyme [Bosea sp. 62]VXB55852.1 Esterase/lipase superfamily enzyme [Bosea sp. 127]VXC66132.1 Esterase/lipase superfamily enzyme [Bosea sp. 29B]VXC96773.1 Esterase/lipase superfamily enzyme [Bosea sp. 125]
MMPIRRKDLPMPAAGRVFMAAAATVFLAGCAGDVKGVLTPVASTVPGTSKVTMLVATTRAADPDAGVLFSGERGKPSYVEMTISLPPDSRRKVGEVQWPSRLPGNPETDFVTLKVDKLDARTGLARLHERVSRVPKRRVMVFVHGFNNRFEDAVYRFAQIVHDSDADVVPVLFTWPSRGSLFAYGYDRESATYSRNALESLLQNLARDPAVGEVSLLAHSMGNWVALESLTQMAVRNRGIPPKIANVMLASPDVDADVFRTQIAEMTGRRPKFTLFVSQDDRALAVSRRVWGGKDRLGAVDPDVEPYKTEFEQDKITVLNLTKLRTGDKLNHGKFAESPEVVKLIGTRLVDGQPITDSRIGLGDRLIEVTGSAAAAVGTAAGIVVSAPVAVIDSQARRNLGDRFEHLGNNIQDTGAAVGDTVTTPIQNPGALR